jgi:hypothetical protein
MLWYPSFEPVAVSPDAVLGFLKERGIVFHPISTRYQAKLEVFSRLECVAATAFSPEEAEILREALEAASVRFGGPVIPLLPCGE